MSAMKKVSSRPCSGHGIAIGLALLGLACGSPQDPLDEIRELHRDGRFAESVDRLRALVDEDPSQAETNLLLGVALLRTGNGGLAIWPLRRAAESPEHAVRAGLLLTQAMLESRTAPDAVTAVDRVLAIEPDNVNALALRMQAYLAIGRLEDAMTDIHRILDLDPENLAVLVPRVTTLISMQRIDEAETALETARERLESAEEGVAPSMLARLCIARGLFTFEKGEPEAAEVQYGECLEQFPTDPLAVTEASAFYQRIGEPERATEILEQAFEISGSTVFRMALARRKGALGDADAQQRLLREEAEERPSPITWFALADFHVQRDEFDAALEAFEEALAASPDPSPMLLFAYADTLVQAERYDDARAVIEGLEQPVLSDLIRGRILLGEGDARGALDAFEAGIRLWPNNPSGRYLAGQAAEYAGDFERAVSEYRESLRSNPAFTRAGLDLATLYAARGDNDAALDAAWRYVTSHPADPEGYLVSIRVAHGAERHAIAAQGLQRFGQLPGQAAAAVSEEATLLAAGRGPALAVESIQGSGLDLTDPANASALRMLLMQLSALEEHGQADGLVHAALEAHPDAAVFHELQGRVLRDAGAEPSLSRAAYDRALELDPGEARALVGLAEMSAESGDLEGAVALYDRASEADPEDPAPARAAAQLLLDAQQTDRARERLERLLDRHPREAGAARDLARIHAERGELDRALVLAKRAAWFREPGAEEDLARIRDLRAEPERTAEAAAPE
jgi:tetratricopeptide (TPR) repeat protein